MTGGFLLFKLAALSTGQHVVHLTTEGDVTLLTPENAELAADRLRAYAASCRESHAMLAAHPGALATLISNQGGRA
jgi:hypothetical protein